MRGNADRNAAIIIGKRLLREKCRDPEKATSLSHYIQSHMKSQGARCGVAPVYAGDKGLVQCPPILILSQWVISICVIPFLSSWESGVKQVHDANEFFETCT